MMKCNTYPSGRKMGSRRRRSKSRCNALPQRMTLTPTSLPIMTPNSLTPTPYILPWVDEQPPHESWTLVIRTVMGAAIAMNTEAVATICSVKRQTQSKQGTPPDQQLLILDGKLLEDD